MLNGLTAIKLDLALLSLDLLQRESEVPPRASFATSSRNCAASMATLRFRRSVRRRLPPPSPASAAFSMLSCVRNAGYSAEARTAR